jgi:hypothetical protein
MACDHDTEQQLLPVAFVIVAGEKSVTNWGWFMQWLRKEISVMVKVSLSHINI